MKFDTIKGRTANVVDVEVLRNCFTATFYDAVNKEKAVFEFSERKFELTEFLTYLNDRIDTDILVGYNINHYDIIIINYICLMFRDTSIQRSYLDCTAKLKALSDCVINREEKVLAPEVIQRINGLRRENIFTTLDLATLHFSKKLMASLKALQITMDYENVQEMVIDWNKDIPADRIDELLSYNMNDVMSSYQLLTQSVADLEVRLHIEEEYDINCISIDSVNSGVLILKSRYVEETGSEPLIPTHSGVVPIKDIVLDRIKFEIPEFQAVLDEVKEHVHVEKYLRKTSEYDDVEEDAFKFKKQFVLHGVMYSFGIGGLHSINVPGIIRPLRGWLLKECDVESLYPIMILNNDCVPRHLGDAFRSVYQGVLDERLEAKHGKAKNPKLKVTDTMLKFALNGITGNMGSKYSWLYDPAQVLKIRINGQLLILMLVEKLIGMGCQIVSVNTDGVNALIPEDRIGEYDKICADWEEMAKLKLAYTDYEQLIIRDVNNYIAVKKGFEELYAIDPDKAIESKTSTIGTFTEDVALGKGLTVARIVPHVLSQHFLNNRTIEDIIYNEKDFKMFIMSQKPRSDFSVLWGETLGIQLSNRYYVSQRGKYLCKYVDTPSKGIEKIMTQPVILVNDFKTVPKDIKDMNIYYPYYLNACRKLIDKIDPKQMTLF